MGISQEIKDKRSIKDKKKNNNKDLKIEAWTI